jgi:hypothetical protein
MIRRPTVTKVVEGIVFVRIVTKIPMTMFLRPMLLKTVGAGDSGRWDGMGFGPK